MDVTKWKKLVLSQGLKSLREGLDEGQLPQPSAIILRGDGRTSFVRLVVDEEIDDVGDMINAILDSVKERMPALVEKTNAQAVAFCITLPGYGGAALAAVLHFESKEGVETLVSTVNLNDHPKASASKWRRADPKKGEKRLFYSFLAGPPPFAQA